MLLKQPLRLLLWPQHPQASIIMLFYDCGVVSSSIYILRFLLQPRCLCRYRCNCGGVTTHWWWYVISGLLRGGRIEDERINASTGQFDPRLVLFGRGCWPQPARGKEMPRQPENQGRPWVEEGAIFGTRPRKPRKKWEPFFVFLLLLEI
jgi:hypothetical protein